MRNCILLLLLSFAVFRADADDRVKQPDTYNYNRGVEETRNNNMEEALVYFNKELGDNPKNGYAYAWVSSIYSIQGEKGKALTAVNNAIRLLPKKDVEFLSGAYQLRAGVYCELEDTVKALADLATAIKLNGQDTDIYEKRAQLYYEQGRYDLADADYNAIKGIDEGSLMGYMGIGRNRIAQKRWSEAVEQFSHVKNLYSDYSSAYSFCAEAYLGQEKWAEATDDLVKALTIDGNDKAFSLMQSLKEPAAGMMVAKLKIQGAKEPNSGYYHHCAGIICEVAKEYEKALGFYQESMKRDAEVLTLRRISACYMELGNLDDALATINQAIAMDTTKHELISQKAEILMYSQQYSQSIAEWDKLVELFPDNALYYYERANTKVVAGDTDGAIDDYTMAITFYPKFPYALALRADMYTRQGKADLAKADWQQVIDTEAELNNIDRSPYAYIALGNNDKAIALVDSIIASDVDNGGNYYDAACIYSRMKNKEKALGYLALALEKGYTEIRHIMMDYDMDFLRDTEEFKSLIDKYKRNAPQKTTSQDVRKEERVSEIPFTKENGVCNVKCKINDLPLYFVFDTGASTVSLSMVEASFMMKNGYLSKTDVVGSTQFSDAVGNVSEGTVVNLRKVKFGDLELDNVRASVVRNQKAPLLLGQSVLSRAGKIEIDNKRRMIVVRYMK